MNLGTWKANSKNQGPNSQRLPPRGPRPKVPRIQPIKGTKSDGPIGAPIPDMDAKVKGER